MNERKIPETCIDCVPSIEKCFNCAMEYKQRVGNLQAETAELKKEIGELAKQIIDLRALVSQQRNCISNLKK